MLIQAYLKRKNIDAKIEQSKHAQIKYEHMLSEINRYMRDTEFKDHDLIVKLKHIDNEIIESKPNMNKYNKKYHKKYKKIRSFIKNVIFRYAAIFL